MNAHSYNREHEGFDDYLTSKVSIIIQIYLQIGEIMALVDSARTQINATAGWSIAQETSSNDDLFSYVKFDLTAAKAEKKASVVVAQTQALGALGDGVGESLGLAVLTSEESSSQSFNDSTISGLSAAIAAL